MKRFLFLLLGAATLPFMATAQTFSWQPTDSAHSNIASMDFHLDYGSTLGLSYGRSLSVGIPIVVGAELSAPFGKDRSDDWKIQANGHALLWQQHNWSVSAKAGICQLQYRSEIAMVKQMGSEFALMLGYDRPHWGIAAITSWQKPWAAKVQHLGLQNQYPEIYNGWIGQTGSNVRVDLRAHANLGLWTAFLSLGKIYGQNFQDNPTFPFAATMSLAKQF